MESSEDLDPVLSQSEFNEIVELLFCHGLHKNFHNLLLKIVEKFPDLEQTFSSPHRQTLLLLAYCHKFQLSSPLPDIRDHRFLWTLHEGLVGALKTDTAWVDTMGKLDVYKLVGGLRCLLTRAILLQPKFIPKDIESTIGSYFPTLPIKPSNSKAWQNWADILKLSLEDRSEALTEVNTLNKKTVGHMTAKLDNLAVERKKTSQDDSFITVWKSVTPKFDDFVRLLRIQLPEQFLDKIASHSHPKIKMLSTRIQPSSSEDEVIQFFYYLCDIHTESQFWTSNFVMEKLSGI